MLDHYDIKWYADGDNDCNDCANLRFGALRTLRGGPTHQLTGLQAAYRDFSTQTLCNASRGVRCARNAK